MRFEDKVVIVTGASSGIGEGVARKFLDEGALVVGCGIEPEMHIESSRAIYVQANLTEFAQAQHVVEEMCIRDRRRPLFLRDRGLPFSG